eukprot:s225_g9.t1
MSGPYHSPQARQDRALLRHLHRRLGQASTVPTPLAGEGYGRWHTRMMQDMAAGRDEDAEAWRREHGPWTSDEIREWFSASSAPAAPGGMSPAPPAAVPPSAHGGSDGSHLCQWLLMLWQD